MQGNRDTRIQGYKDTGIQGYIDTRRLEYRDTKIQDAQYCLNSVKIKPRGV